MLQDTGSVNRCGAALAAPLLMLSLVQGVIDTELIATSVNSLRLYFCWVAGYSCTHILIVAYRTRQEPVMSTGIEPSDAELLCQVSQRNAEALELLYERHARFVFDFICQMVGPGSAACDILSETFYSLWREANEGRGLPRVKVYLLHAAHEQCCRHLEALRAPAAFQTIAYTPAQAIT